MTGSDHGHPGDGRPALRRRRRPEPARRAARAARRGRAAGARRAPRGAGDLGRGRARGPAGAGLRGVPRARCRTPRRPRPPQVAAFCWGVLGQADFTRSDASSGSAAARPPTWPGSSPRRGCAASGWSRSRPRCSAWSTRPSAARPASTPPRARTSSGRSTRPAGVLCDLGALETLPRHDFVAGLAEVVKCGFIADPRILELVEAHAERSLQRTPSRRRVGRAAELVERCGRRQGARRGGGPHARPGLREILNYGHTFGHAIEQVERFQWRHGAAVSVGMVFAAELAAAGRPAGRGRRRPAPSVLAVARPAADLPRRPLGPAARRDAPGQEDPRRPAAVRRARGRRRGPPGSRGRTRRCSSRPTREIERGRAWRRHRRPPSALRPGGRPLGCRHDARPGAQRPQPRPARGAGARGVRLGTHADLAPPSRSGRASSGWTSRSGRPTTRPSSSAGCTRRSTRGRTWCSTRRRSRTTPTRCGTRPPR